MVNDLNQKDIDARIRSLVAESGLSIRKFAISVNLDVSNTTKKYNGDKFWTVNDINKICENLRIRKGWLLDGQGQKFRATDEMLDKIPAAPRISEESIGDILEMYAQRLRLVDDLRTSLKSELEEVRSIKQELINQREHTAKLQELLSNAIFALRSANTSEHKTLMAAEDNI